MSGAIREVRECGLTEFVFFERPRVCQLESYTYFVKPGTDWWVPFYPPDNMQRPTGPRVWNLWIIAKAPVVR